MKMIALWVGYLAMVLPNHAVAETFAAFTEPIQTIRLSAAVPGRISEVLVKRGDRIRTDEVVVRLESNVLEASRLIAEQEAASTTQMRSLEVEHEIKQHRFMRVSELLKKGAVSPKEAKRAEADTEIAQLSLQAAMEQHKLSDLKLREIDSKIELRCVRSQVEGLVIDVLQEPGEFVSTSDPHVVTIVVLDQLRCTFFVSTRFADRFESGESIQVILNGRQTSFRKESNGQPANETGRDVLGTIEYIAEVTQADSGRVRFDVLIDNRKGQFRSGLRCRLESPRDSNASTKASNAGNLIR